MAGGRWPEEGRILTNSTGDRLRELHIDVIGFDFHLEAGLLNAGVQAMVTRCQAVLPAMPGAGHDPARDLTLSNWAAGVGTDPIDRKPAFLGVKQRDDPVPYDALQAGADGDLGGSCDSHTVGHEDTKSESVGKAEPSRPTWIVNCDRV